MQQDDSYLPVIDAHPKEILSQWTKQSSKAKITSKNAQATKSANEFYHSVSGACLEYRELLKTSEMDVW